MVNKELRDFISYNSDRISKLNISNVTDKWEPVLIQFFKGINVSKETMSYICLYTEVIHMYIEAPIIANPYCTPTRKIDLSLVITDLRDSYIGQKSKKSKVVGKVYNYVTRSMEYELEDGNFIKINDNITPIETPTPFEIFPMEFQKIINLAEYRNNKIDEIL